MNTFDILRGYLSLSSSEKPQRGRLNPCLMTFMHIEIENEKLL